MNKKSNYRFAIKTTGILIVAFWCLLPRFARAATPQMMNFQGKLLNTANVPQNGTFCMGFSIYSVPTGGTPLWGQEQQSGINVSNGVFSVQLGKSLALSPSVFSGGSAYLDIAVGTTCGGLSEMTPRQQLVAGPYAFQAASVDLPLPAGDLNYIQLTSILQSGATFYVSSGTVSGPLSIGGIITAGSGNNAITNSAGLLDATKLTNTVPSAQFSGTYSNTLNLTSSGNSYAGDGSALVNVTANHLLPGDTNYIQNRSTLLMGTTFYVSSGTVGGEFTATGTVTMGGTPGVNDVTIKSNLITNNNATIGGNLTANGVGPHVFNGNIQVKGNNINDSAGTSRITLGDPVLINAPNNGISVTSGNLYLSTSVFFNGTPNSDNFIAYPFTALTNVALGNAVVAGAGGVSVVQQNANASALGFAVTSASAGNTVWIAMSGIICEAVSGSGTINIGTRVCTSNNGTYLGSVESCTSAGAPIGKALSGTNAAGQPLCVAIFNGN
ncbi:MAG: autotransporter outer membrane beta-barrel domain-containing protein [Elusimicrobiota bacterium]